MLFIKKFLKQTNPSAILFNPIKKFLSRSEKSSWSLQTRRMRYGIELITSKWEKRRKKGRFCSLWCPKLSKIMWEIHVSKLYWNPLCSKRWKTTKKFFKTRRSSEGFQENFLEIFKLSDFTDQEGVGHCWFSRNSSDSCWEHWIKFILVWVWVKSLNGGMSNASRFMTQDVFRVTEAVVVKQSWSSLTTNFSRPYMTTINHLVWSFRSFQRVILVCQAYYACPRWNNFKRLL